MEEVTRTEADIRQHYADKNQSARNNVPGRVVRYTPEFRNGRLTKVRIVLKSETTRNG